ncbi:MAG: YceI family protein [Bacteroidota bacterium]
MSRFILFLGACAAISFSLLYTSSPSVEFPAVAPGELTFIGNAGSDNLFTVNHWKFDRLENLDAPENIQVTAILDMKSITCDWKDLEKNLHKKKDYFYSKKFGTAQITIDGAEAQADGSYVAEAELSLKGITKTVPVTFTLTGEGPYELEATAVVKRRKFNFSGNGPKEEVPVTVKAVVE